MRKVFLLKLGFIVVVVFLFIRCEKDEQETIKTSETEYEIYDTGSGVIGKAGGEISISDKSSPIYGTKVIIPEGALDKNISISLAEGSVKNIELPDNLGPLVKFEPNGLNFNTPIKIILPFNDNGSSQSDLVAYYIDDENESYEEFPIITSDQVKSRYTIETNHFSAYCVSGPRFSDMEVNLYKMDDKIAANVNIYSWSSGKVVGLARLLTLLTWYDDGIFSAEDVIFWEKGSHVYAIFAVELCKKTFGFSNDFIERKYLVVRRVFENGQIKGIEIYDNAELKNPILGEYDFDNDKYEKYYQGNYEKFFQGIPLFFKFNYTPVDNESYYLRIEWNLAMHPNSIAGSRFTAIAKVNTKDNPIKGSSLTINADDKNKNAVNDYYETGKALVKTVEATEVTANTAKAGCYVLNEGGFSVTERGVCYSTSPNPNINELKQIGQMIGIGTVTVTLKDLIPDKTYYYRAYATNSKTTTYGEEFSFRTTGLKTQPTVTSVKESDITSTSATLGGIVITDGGETVTERGVVYSTSPNPTTNNTKVTMGNGVGSFNQIVTGLTPNTLYYFRAYAVNSAGTSYDTQRSFTTLQAVVVLSTLTTTTQTDVTSNSANLGGNITSDGGGAITERGIIYGTSPSSTTKMPMGSGSGSFSGTLSGLNANTLYYAKAYANNSAGTSYGTQISFTTLPTTVILATVTTASQSNVTTNSAYLGGNVTNAGGGTITERGIVYSTTPNPTISNTRAKMGSGTGIFGATVTGLLANTTYYVRAYAINTAGASYGAEISFITNVTTFALPTVTTNPEEEVISTCALLGGNVTDAGGGTVSEYGIYYGTTSNPEESGQKVKIYKGTGNYSATVCGLLPNTLYYVKTYAINEAGITYGNQISFKTLEDSQSQENSGIFTDSRDGNTYNWIKIGNQIWMAENLKYLPDVSPPSYESTVTPVYYVYDYLGTNVLTATNTSNYKNYGVLYNWNASKVACPSNWHLPSDSEWTQLSNFLIENGYGFEGSGDDIAKSLSSNTLWNTTYNTSQGTPTNSRSTNNSSGFSGLPVGFRLSNEDGLGNVFHYMTFSTLWWSSNEYSSTDAWTRHLGYNKTTFNRDFGHKSGGLSVRCIKD